MNFFLLVSKRLHSMAHRHFTLCLFMLINVVFLKVIVFIFVISGKKKSSVFNAYRCQTWTVCVYRMEFFWLLTPCKIIIWWRLLGKRRCFYLRVKEQALTLVLFPRFWLATFLPICLYVREMHVSVLAVEEHNRHCCYTTQLTVKDSCWLTWIGLAVSSGRTCAVYR